VKKANYIKKFIIQYYDKYKRSLPWRSKNNSLQDPYCTLISEIMLQQTRVDKVKVFYESFLRKWPNIYALSCADISQILTHWSGLGYYRRAINLHKTSKIIANVYSGIIPADKETLKSLPGIGEYTSSAIISFAFGKYSIILDTNIKRFIMRIFGLKDDIKEKDLIKYAKILFPKKNTSSFAQGIMDFASNTCLKINPRCEICLLKKYCNFGLSEKKIIKKISKVKPKRFCYSYFLFTNQSKFLVTKRPLNGILAGLYEVPTSYWEKGKWSKNYYKDIELQLNELNKSNAKIIKHEFSHFILYTKLSLIEIKKNKFIKNKYTWTDRKKIKNLPISSLTNKIINYSFSLISSLK
tara:strand:- start:342 stop:1400 length:1059 start_codon:yes stop_codon:yes gene_type:complete